MIPLLKSVFSAVSSENLLSPLEGKRQMPSGLPLDTSPSASESPAPGFPGAGLFYISAARLFFPVEKYGILEVHESALDLPLIGRKAAGGKQRPAGVRAKAAPSRAGGFAARFPPRRMPRGREKARRPA